MSQIESVFKQIEELSAFKFAYNSTRLDITRKINISVDNQTIDAILKEILGTSDYKYQIVDRYIIITDKNGQNFTELAASQSKKVSGRVTDSAGMPLPGASVIVKGTATGAISDTNGDYSLLNVPENATLLFSFVGMKPQEIIVGDKTIIHVALEEETIGLEEVIAIGYGTVKKIDLTGSVSSIKTEDLKKVPVTSFDQAIQGRAAGVQVTQASSAPGGRVLIRVRGGNSLSSSNEPLYVVDGYPISAGTSAGGSGAGQNPLATLNTSDIASIEILKDASATAIYGARGANGVVLITTKRGQIGSTKVTFDGYSGIQQVANKLDMMNAREFAELVNEARTNEGLSPAFPNNSDLYNFPDPASLGEGVDYQNEIFRSAPIHSYNLGISGGNESVRYAFGGSYFGQTGIVEGTDFNRASFRTNIDSKISEKLTISTNLTASHVWGDIGTSEGDGGNNSGVVNSAILMPPTVPVKQADGSYTQMNPTPGGSTIQNPVPIARLATNYQEIDRVFRQCGGCLGNYKWSFFSSDFRDRYVQCQPLGLLAKRNGKWI